MPSEPSEPTTAAKRPHTPTTPSRAAGDFRELTIAVTTTLESPDEPPHYVWRFDVYIADDVCSWLGSHGEVRGRLDARQQRELDELAHAVFALPWGTSGSDPRRTHALTTMRTLGWTREPPRPTPLCVRWSIADFEGSGRETGPAPLRVLLERVAAWLGAALPASSHARLEQAIGLLRVPEPAPGFDAGAAVPAPESAVPIPFEAGVSVRIGQQPGTDGLYRIRRDPEAKLLRVVRASDRAELAHVAPGKRIELTDAFALIWSGANSLRLEARAREPLYVQRLDR